MTSLEEDLDITSSRITELEKEVIHLKESVFTLYEQLKESQKYIIRLAHNQSQMTKRIATWPFIGVEKHNDRK